MENNSLWCPEKVCRICLNESENMKPINSAIDGDQRTLFDMLTFVSNLSINTAENFPKNICSGCEVSMCKADVFKRRCINSETFLRQFLDGGNFDVYELESYRKTVVKDEISIQKEQLINKLPCQMSIVGAKSSNNNENADFDLVFKSDCKDEIFAATPLVSTSKVEIDVISEENDILSNKNQSKPVKIEEDELDSHDYDNFEPTESSETKDTTVNDLRVYTCSCGNIYNKKDEYKTHLRENYCSGYKKTAKIKVEKKNSGKRNSTIKKQITCPECNLEFDTVKACKLHQQKHNNETEKSEDFHCTLCMRKFNRKSSYTNHMKNHNIKSKVKFTCDTCKREFQHKAHLDNHILSVHTREKGFPCELCNTNFSTQESLELHKQSHSIEKKHQCNLCNKAFYMLSTLNDHIRTHTGEKPFLCSVCGRGFSQKTNLAQHMRRHQGLKPFKCNDCDRRFVSKGELVAHNRKHSGAHPFVCDECGSGFTTSSSLVKHRRTHTGERPYSCDLCPARFAASGTLKNHRRTHTGEKPFQCSYCEKAFVQRHDLISHIRCHTGERPFVCGCGQAFRKSSALKAHVRMHSKEPVQGVNLLLGGVDGISGQNCVVNDSGH